MRRTGRQYRRVRLPGWRRTLLLLGVWALVAVPVTATLFLHGSRTTVLAGHDAVVRPTLDGYATLDLGPYLPNLRYPTGSRVGADIDLGARRPDSYEALIQRYAFIASQPEGQIGQGPVDAARPWPSTAWSLGALIGLAGPGVVAARSAAGAGRAAAHRDRPARRRRLVAASWSPARSSSIPGAAASEPG